MSPQRIFPLGCFLLSSPSPPSTSYFQNTGARARHSISARQRTSRGLDAIPILGDKARQEGGGSRSSYSPTPSFSKPADITHLFPRAVGLGQGVGKGLGAQFWRYWWNFFLKKKNGVFHKSPALVSPPTHVRAPAVGLEEEEEEEDRRRRLLQQVKRLPLTCHLQGGGN